MGITLYYIKGINAIDTPNFSSKEAQDLYFFRHIVGEVEQEDYWYPPYLDNSIRVSGDDVTLAIQANYMSIDFQEKKYYYFIDNVRNFPDGQLQLNIVLDSIQTYMFDIDFISALITRKCIRRFEPNTHKINRNYIRENLSEGIFEQTQYEESEPDILWAVIQATDKLGLDESVPQYYAIDNNIPSLIHKSANVDFKLYDGTKVYLIPINVKYDNISQVSYLGNTISLSTLKDYYGALSKDERVVSIRIIRDLALLGLTISIVNNVINVTLDSTKFSLIAYSLEGQTTNIGGLIRLIDSRVIPVTTARIISTKDDLSFQENIGSDTVFNPRYVPALIDSNYMKYEYGERMQTTTYPLELFDNDTIYLYATKNIDIFTGFRSYEFTDISYIDKYLTRVTLSTEETMTLFNNAWQQWLQANKGTVSEAWAMQHINNVFHSVMSTIPSTSSTGGTSYGDNSSESFSNSISNSRKLSGKGRKRYPRSSSSMGIGSNSYLNLSGSQSYSSAGGGVAIASAMANFAMGEANVISSQNALIDNLKGTPDKISSANSYTADNVMDSLKVYFAKYYVKDYNTVALLIEKNGYAVKEYVNNTNIFTSNVTNIRSRYNFVQLGSCTFDLTILTSNEIKEDIYERLTTGLRLWNVGIQSLVIGDYTYDNGEKI